jgi:hypothetical protein
MIRIFNKYFTVHVEDFFYDTAVTVVTAFMVLQKRYLLLGIIKIECVVLKWIHVARTESSDGLL